MVELCTYFASQYWRTRIGLAVCAFCIQGCGASTLVSAEPDPWAKYKGTYATTAAPTGVRSGVSRPESQSATAPAQAAPTLLARGTAAAQRKKSQSAPSAGDLPKKADGSRKKSGRAAEVATPAGAADTPEHLVAASTTSSTVAKPAAAARRKAGSKRP